MKGTSSTASVGSRESACGAGITSLFWDRHSSSAGGSGSEPRHGQREGGNPTAAIRVSAVAELQSPFSLNRPPLNSFGIDRLTGDPKLWCHKAKQFQVRVHVQGEEIKT